MKKLTNALGWMFLVSLLAMVVSVIGMLNCVIPTESLLWLFFRICANSGIAAIILAVAVKGLNGNKTDNDNTNKNVMGFTSNRGR